MGKYWAGPAMPFLVVAAAWTTLRTHKLRVMQRCIREGWRDRGCRWRSRCPDLSRPRLSVSGFRIRPRRYDRRLSHATDGTCFGAARTKDFSSIYDAVGAGGAFVGGFGGVQLTNKKGVTITLQGGPALNWRLTGAGSGFRFGSPRALATGRERWPCKPALMCSSTATPRAPPILYVHSLQRSSRSKPYFSLELLADRQCPERLPVATTIALIKARANGGTPASPTPLGGASASGGAPGCTERVIQAAFAVLLQPLSSVTRCQMFVLRRSRIWRRC